jgi:hypothetical protein
VKLVRVEFTLFDSLPESLSYPQVLVKNFAIIPLVGTALLIPGSQSILIA